MLSLNIFIGPGPTQCNSCANFNNQGTCVSSCPTFHYVDALRVCRVCNGECLSACSGPNATDCDACRTVYQRASGCLSSCPLTTYKDSANTCQPCHSECSAGGCSGPLATNCMQCRRVTSLLSSAAPTCVAECPPMTYMLNDTASPLVIQYGTPVCVPCSSQCARGCQVFVSVCQCQCVCVCVCVLRLNVFEFE